MIKYYDRGFKNTRIVNRMQQVSLEARTCTCSRELQGVGVRKKSHSLS